MINCYHPSPLLPEPTLFLVFHCDPSPPPPFFWDQFTQNGLSNCTHARFLPKPCEKYIGSWKMSIHVCCMYHFGKSDNESNGNHNPTITIILGYTRQISPQWTYMYLTMSNSLSVLRNCNWMNERASIIWREYVNNVVQWNSNSTLILSQSKGDHTTVAVIEDLH